MNNIHILKHLLEHKEQTFTINQLARTLGINYRIAHTQVKRLETEGIIKTEKAGHSLLCSLTGRFDEQIFAAEYSRRKDLTKDRSFAQIVKRYRQARQPFILLLFGSYAKKTATKHSDIDLLAITEKPEELEEITELIPKPIHLTTVTCKEFLEMERSREPTVGTEALKHNVILNGIEEYYRLLENDH
ncbi:MAG: nucleotidyltransferase domain-containing protein [Candidatus Woesearchaeota archaeon]